MGVKPRPGFLYKFTVRVLVPGGAGLAASLALPPWHIWPLLPVGFSLLVWMLDLIARDEATPARRSRAAALAGWSFGFGWFVFSLSWITEAFQVDAALFAWLIPFVLMLLPAGLALYWAAATAIAMRWWGAGARGLLMLVVTLSVAEWLRGHLFTGFPWNLPGYATDASNALAQTASVVGIYGLTTLVLAWSLLPAMLWRPRGLPAYRLAGLSAATLALCWAGGAWRLQQPMPGVHDDITVSIVQASIPQSMKWQRDRRSEILRRYLDLTAKADTDATPGRHVVIWPETALPYLVAEMPDLRRNVTSGLPSGGHLILGAIRREPAAAASGGRLHVYNSMLVIDHSGHIAASYDKHRLVPFGEFLPFENILGPLGLRKLVPVPLSFTAGSDGRPVRINGLPAFEPLICYEAIFPLSLASGDTRPQWLVNVTNDAWFGTSAGPRQHLAQARFRAIEEGLPLVRAANTGISAIIDAKGNVLRQLGLDAIGVLSARLPLPLGPTLYARWGDIGFGILIAGLLIAIGAHAWKHSKNKMLTQGSK